MIFHNITLTGCCPSVKNILLLDSEGKRVAVRYYSNDWPTNVAKLAFEKSVFVKTLKTNARTEADIALLHDDIIIYKFVQDLHFFVTGNSNCLKEKIRAIVSQGLVFISCYHEYSSKQVTFLQRVAEHNDILVSQKLSQALATSREHLTLSLLK
ncbi:hypothetical protein ACOSQ4_020366 [Xanthoceras sorbifolium]